MTANNARELLIDEILEQNILTKESGLLSYFANNREYLVMLATVDITDWDTK